MSRLARYFRIAVLCGSAIAAESAHAHARQVLVMPGGLRTAFYEHAPRSLAAAMSKAVASWCSSGRGEPHAAAISWICQAQKPVYFRGVDIDGFKSRDGMVCENEGNSDLKYLGMDYVAEQVSDRICMPVEFDGSRYKLPIE
jgi:hypothetical protein